MQRYRIAPFSGCEERIASGVTEVCCRAYARREIVDLHVDVERQIAEIALKQPVLVYGMERDVRWREATQHRTSGGGKSSRALRDASMNPAIAPNLPTAHGVAKKVPLNADVLSRSGHPHIAKVATWRLHQQ